jgi:regulator of microtubule dynamics protein 3
MMKLRQPIAKLILLLVVSFTVAIAQTKEDLFQRGLQCKKENNINAALLCFQELLKSDSSNIEFLTYSSMFYSKKGNEFSDEKTRHTYFNTGLYLAKKALALDANFAESHYCMALALGRINEFADTKTKIANSKDIKLHIDEALRLNPAHAGAYHILGRWNRTIANFGNVERMMINSLYGGVPEGATLEGALNAFIKAVAFEPEFKLHQYELAQTYLDMGKNINAKVWFQKALKVKSNNESDLLINEKCLKALEELK